MRQDRKSIEKTKENTKKRYRPPRIKEYNPARFEAATQASVGGGGSTAAGGTIPVV